jgi:hypothetical protein
VAQQRLGTTARRSSDLPDARRNASCKATPTCRSDRKRRLIAWMSSAAREKKDSASKRDRRAGNLSTPTKRKPMLATTGFLAVQTGPAIYLPEGKGFKLAWQIEAKPAQNAPHPRSPLFADNIQNFSALPVRRVERVAQLAHGVDPLVAIEKFRAVVTAIPNVATDPAPEVNLLDFNPLGCVIAVRGYTHTDHYWQVYFGINEVIARVCGEAGWPTPYVMHGNKNVA